ncbi:MAG: hypothetical protein A3H95_04050 [Acidobacteria bacterium RIFCSPLOWO2_02_FULL_64_15]|nr:MAG: hypothetical protein A3H95_04050 [Acidobacteria bacterium RIFCSPLOWO2_02_FULL_64_15]
MSYSRLTAAVGGLMLLSVAAGAGAQGPSLSVRRVAVLTSGSIAGIVQDEAGAAVSGALVSALGATSSSTLTDGSGRFELRTLPPGRYLVRAQSAGFVSPRGRLVDVRPSARVDSSIALRRLSSSISGNPSPYPVLAAGMGGTLQPRTLPPAAGAETADPAASDDAAAEKSDTDGQDEIAWRLRHARRGVLKDVTFPDEFLAESPPTLETNVFGPLNRFGRSGGSGAGLATGFLTGVPFSGQVILLTTGSVNEDGPDVFASNSFSRGTAYVSLGAPVGDAEWTVRGALTDGDRPSWFAAAAYSTRVPARHRYDLGFSYSTQRYDRGNPATYALREVSDRGHYAGALYGFDTFALAPAVSITYGARIARYDYLETSDLVSPRVALTISPTDRFRLSARASRRALAPGAEEFLPPIEPGLWLPPQRTFSSLVEGQPLTAEHTTHLDVEAARDMGESTVSVRVFHQHVDDQLVTLFGVDRPVGPGAHLGHYFVSSNGDVDATGWSAGIRTALAHRVRGSVEYSRTRAHWYPTASASYLMLLAPSTGRLESEDVHDVATTLEADVPETSTRVVLLYRVSNAFARPRESPDRLDSRFDVQVRQSLPFMDFGAARWEMLLAVRNFFREGPVGSSVYDELLVIHPPKRVVGGLTLKF